MTVEHLKKRLAFVERVIRPAGRRVHAMRFEMHDSAIHSKEQFNDLITSADLACDTWIKEAVAREFPSDSILTEETGLIEPHTIMGGQNVQKEYTWSQIAALESVWIADPIDGTMNYVHRLEHYAVCLAWMSLGVVMVSGIYIPATDELLLSAKGLGSTCNGQKLRVSSTSSLDRALIGTGFGYFDRQERYAHLEDVGKITDHVRGIRHIGSASCNLAKVAQGQFDGFWIKKVKPWDIAPGLLLVEEAGGKVLPLDAKNDLYESGSLLAANESLLPLIQEVLTQSIR